MNRSQLLDAESAGGEGRGSKELLDPRKKKITRIANEVLFKMRIKGITRSKKEENYKNCE